MISQILINALVSGTIYALIASGFTLIYGTMNFFHMGFGATVLTGAVSFYALYRLLNLPIVASAALACIFTVALMLVIDRVCYYSFRQKRVPSWSLVAASMAVGILLQALVAIAFGSRSLTVYAGVAEGHDFFGAKITTLQALTIGCTVLIVVAMTLFIKRTKAGRLIRALANSKFMSKVVGVDVERVYMAVIIASTFLASVAGILLGLNSDIRPTMASTALLKAIVCTVIGGVGNFRGAMVAGLVLALLENTAIYFLGSGWRDAIPLLLIILFMIIRPPSFVDADRQAV